MVPAKYTALLTLDPNISGILYCSISLYNPKENAIYLNEDKLNKSDAKHELMFAILTIISAKDNGYGFDTDGQLKVLNVGLAEILTNFLVGNESEEHE